MRSTGTWTSPSPPAARGDELIELLLATDSVGNEQALARRMGVEELIWDCEYWAAGMSEFQPYRVCYGKRGKIRRGMNKTVAHRDHIHIGMTKAGAAAKTSSGAAILVEMRPGR